MLKISKRKIQYNLFYILLFFSIYNTKFHGLPISTANVIAIMGIVAFLLYVLNNKIVIYKNMLSAIVLFGLLIIWNFITIILNSTYQITFLIYEIGVGIIVPFFGTFLVSFCGREYTKGYRNAIQNILRVVEIQSVITITSFFFGKIQTIIYSVQDLPDKVKNSLEGGIRAYGLGSGFDLGSFVISYSLLITVYLYLTCSKKERNKYIIAYLIQAFAGLLMARSAAVGIVLSLVFLVYTSKGAKRTIFFVIKVTAIVMAVCWEVMTFLPELLNKYRSTIIWLTEFLMMDRIAATGKTTNTLTVLFHEMYFVPEHFKTWIIGDGLFTTVTGNPYMNTDPFYMRALLFFGLPGVVIFLLFVFSIVSRLIIKKNIKGKDNNEYEIKLFNDLLTFILLLNLIIYIKLDSHCFWLLFYLMWVQYFNTNRRVKVGKI